MIGVAVVGDAVGEAAVDELVGVEVGEAVVGVAVVGDSVGEPSSAKITESDVCHWYERAQQRQDHRVRRVSLARASPAATRGPGRAGPRF